MATLNCDIGRNGRASYEICRRGNKVFLVLLYNLCILLVTPHIVEQTTCQTDTILNTIESNKKNNNVNKKVTEDDYVYVSDYLKRIREVENFDHHYLLPHENNNFMGASYPDYPVDFMYGSYHPMDYGYDSSHSHFRELMQQTTEFPSGFTGKSETFFNEDIKQRPEPITFGAKGVKQLNYSINSVESLQLIDVDYENDVYFLHENVITRLNLNENGVELENVAIIEDTHEPIKGVHLITWHELLIVLVREGDHYNVYVKTPQNENVRKIQRLVFPNSKLGKCKLMLKDDRVYLVITIGLNKAVGKIFLYKWHDSHFAKEHEQETFVVDELFFFNSEQDPLVMIVSHGNRLNTKTKANVYHVAPDGKLDLLQYIFFGMDVVHKFTVQNNHYILACYSKNVCFIHKYVNGKFTKAHQIDRKFTRTVGVESDNTLIGIQLDDELIFSLNSAITQTITHTDISTLFLFKFSFVELLQTNRKYLVLFYLYPSHLNIQMIEIEINQKHIATEMVSATRHEHEFIKDKMNELRLIVESKGEIIQEINNVASTVIRKDKALHIQSPVKTSAPVHIKNGLIKSLTVHCDEMNGNTEHLLHEIAGIRTRTGDLLQQLQQPQNYERYKRAFKPDYKTTKFIVKNLHYAGPEFDNLLLKSRLNTITAVFNAKSIEANNLNVTKGIINNIELNDVVQKGYDDVIYGFKTFNQVNSETLTVKWVNDIDVDVDLLNPPISFRATEEEDDFLSLSHDISVDKLQITSINSLPWSDLEKSSELKTTKEINGNLYFKRPGLVRNLNVEAVNHISVSDLLSKDGDQQVESVVWINSFFAPSISTRTVNGMNFKENVALQGQENHIRSHVAIAKMNVTSGLKLTEEDVSSGRHVVGTRKEDLLQFYTGDVVIQGSLTLKRAKTDAPFTQVLVGDRQFGMDVEQYYWVDNKSQDIPSFKFHSTVSVPQLYTNNVNSHPSLDYLLVHPTTTPNKHTRLVMKHAHVPGNVVPEGDNGSKLVQISRDAVRRGDGINLKGSLKFDGELTVDLLNSININGQNVEQFARKDSSSYHFKSTKRLHNLSVYGDLHSSEKFSVQNYNGTDFYSFMSDAVYVNEPFNLGNALFDDIRIHNLTVQEMQGVPFDHFLSSIYSVLNTSTSVRNIRVSENAFFEHELHVDVLNEVPLDRLFENIVRKDRGAVIKGKKTFKSGFKIKQNLWSPKVNGYDLQTWQDAALLSTSEQIVTGNWKINNLKTKYLGVKDLNGIRASDILSVKDPVVDIYSDVTVEHLKDISDCKGNLKHDIGALLHTIYNPQSKTYEKITCDGTLLYPMHFKSKFTDILTDAVTIHSDHPINAKVEFINRPYIKYAKSLTNLINGIDILNIYTDALKYHSSDKKQLVYAPKKFIDPIEMKFTVVKYKLDSLLVNGVNVVELNNTIYRKNQGNYVLEKKVFLKTPIVGELNVKGSVNGVKLGNVAFEKDGHPLENVFLNQLQVVNDLIVANVNNMSLDYLLDNRVRLYGPPQEIYGTLTFQKLSIHGLNHIPYINGIDSRSLVYLKWLETQVIDGKKVIKNGLSLNGPVHCLKMNDRDFVETIRSNVKLDVAEHLENLEVNDLVAHAGVLVSQEIDGRSIDSVLHVTPKSLDKMLPTVPHLKEIVQSTQEMVQSKTPTKRFLYLDYATDLDIVFKTEEISAVQSHTELLAFSNLDCPEQLEIRVKNGGKIFLRKHTGIHRTICKDSPIDLKLNLGINNCAYDKDLVLTWNNDKLQFTYKLPGVLKSNLNCFASKDKHFVGFLSTLSDHVNSFEIIYLTKANQWGLKQALDFQDASNAKILTSESFSVLVVTSKKGVEFFNFNTNEEKFEAMETITGSFNLISDLVNVGGEKMIGLALKNSKAVTIFKLIGDGSDGPEIQFFQTLRFEARVKAVQAFSMNGESHLAIIMTNGHFYIYRYNYIDGWIQINYSYFNGMESLVAFEHQNNEYLLIISPDSASAIRIYNQS